MHILQKLFSFLNPYERKRTFFLIVIIFLMALIEMIGVASILPFMTILINPELINTNDLLKYLFKKSNIIGINSTEQFLFLLGVSVFLILIFSLFFKFITYFVQLRFTSLLQYNIARRLVEGYLNQPYDWFLNRHSAELGKNILNEVTLVVRQGFTPILNLFKQMIVTISIVFILVLVNPKLTLIMGATLGFVYITIYLTIKKLILSIANKRLGATKWIFTVISEAFNATKEIKVSGVEQSYIDKFSNPAKTLAKIQAKWGVINQLPRYTLEGIVFGGMLILVLYLMTQSDDYLKAIPIISLYAFAGYRLMPPLQEIFNSYNTIKLVSPALDNLHKDFKNLKFDNKNKNTHDIILKKSIVLKNVSYKYPDASKTSLKNINFTIPINTSIGIVGPTGSGKTTTVDIILGLLNAQKGSFEIDGKIINEHNCRAWQKNIGYVSQHIFLADDTLAANIAFGIEPEKIDNNAILRASKIAKLDDFVNEELPLKYQTKIGERGIRLSGGQRQRIGIARALYNNPKVLVLDEATSALDNITEKAVMDEIYNVSKDMTLIIISHRLSTVNRCNSILMIEKGEVKSQGTFEQLIIEND